MLFLQGRRDALAEPAWLEQALGPLPAAVTLHWIEEADHGFAVPKRSGREFADVCAELAEVAAACVQDLGAA